MWRTSSCRIVVVSFRGPCGWGLPPMLQVLLPDLSLFFSLSLSLPFATFTEFECIPPSTIMCDDVSLNSQTPTSCFIKGVGRTMGQYRWSRGRTKPSKDGMGRHMGCPGWAETLPRRGRGEVSVGTWLRSVWNCELITQFRASMPVE